MSNIIIIIRKNYSTHRDGGINNIKTPTILLVHRMYNTSLFVNNPILCIENQTNLKILSITHQPEMKIIHDLKEWSSVQNYTLKKQAVIFYIM